jgi:DNA invertase Pin-like site-specific DNA recombinase
MRCGYARVSTIEQSNEIQIDQLTAAGCDKIFSEQKSGTNTEHRDQLAECLAYVREGDELVVVRLDRLARSTGDLLRIVETLEKKGVGFRCLLQPIDTTTPHGRLFVTILAAMAAFETELRKERQMEGIAKAKATGIYKGRKPCVDPEVVRKAKTAEPNATATELARRFKVSKKTVYRCCAGMYGESPIKRVL